MSDLQLINAQLVELELAKDKARIQFNKSRAILKRTPEYKARLEAEKVLNDLGDKCDDLYVQKFRLESAINKQTLIDLGFECRTGYIVKIKPGYDDSYMYKCIIVHENTPQFDQLIVRKNYDNYDEPMYTFNIENLAVQSKENECWNRAWTKWSSLTIDEQNELIR